MKCAAALLLAGGGVWLESSESKESSESTDQTRQELSALGETKKRQPNNKICLTSWWYSTTTVPTTNTAIQQGQPRTTMDSIVAKQSRKEGTPPAPAALSLKSLSISGGNAHVSINNVPADVLGRALDYLPFGDVLNTRLVQKKLGQEVIKNVCHLNMMNAGQLNPRIAFRFPSVKSIDVLCLLTKFELPDEYSASSDATFIVDKRATSGTTRFLKEFKSKSLRKVFFGGYYDGSKRAYEASICRGPTNQRALCQTLGRNLVCAFDGDESPLSIDIYLEGLSHLPFCSNGPNRSGEPCEQCSLVMSTFPRKFVLERLSKGIGSTDENSCLSTFNILRHIESRPDGGAELAQAQIPLILEQLISNGAIRRHVVSSTRTRSSSTILTEFIDWNREEGSGNDGREQAIFSLRDSARSDLKELFEYAPASRSIAANAIVESMRSSMRGNSATGKIVFHGDDLNLLADEEGFGLDRNEFIALDGMTFRIILSEQRNHARRPADLPTHIQF